MIRAVNITTKINGMSVKMAARVLFLVFIRCVRLNCISKSQIDLIEPVETDYVMSRLDRAKVIKKLRKMWKESELKAFYANAMESFRNISERLVVNSSSPESCVICMMNEACSYVVHGDTAHSGFCPSCAMELMVSKAKKCAICRQGVESVVFFAEKGSCSCGKTGCERRIYSSSLQIHSEKTRIVERYKCQEINRSEFVVTLGKVF